MDIVGDLNIETTAEIIEICREKHQINTKMIMSVLDEYFIRRLKQLIEHAERNG